MWHTAGRRPGQVKRCNQRVERGGSTRTLTCVWTGGLDVWRSHLTGLMRRARASMLRARTQAGARIIVRPVVGHGPIRPWASSSSARASMALGCRARWRWRPIMMRARICGWYAKRCSRNIYTHMYMFCSVCQSVGRWCTAVNWRGARMHLGGGLVRYAVVIVDQHRVRPTTTREPALDVLSLLSQAD